MKNIYIKPIAELTKIEAPIILVGSKGPGSGNGQGESSIPGGAAKEIFSFDVDIDDFSVFTDDYE